MSAGSVSNELRRTARFSTAASRFFSQPRTRSIPGTLRGTDRAAPSIASRSPPSASAVGAVSSVIRRGNCRFQRGISAASGTPTSAERSTVRSAR